MGIGQPGRVLGPEQRYPAGLARRQEAFLRERPELARAIAAFGDKSTSTGELESQARFARGFTGVPIVLRHS